MQLLTSFFAPRRLCKILTSHADFQPLPPVVLATLIAAPLKVPNVLRIFQALIFDLLCHQGKLSKTPPENFFAFVKSSAGP